MAEANHSSLEGLRIDREERGAAGPSRAGLWLTLGILVVLGGIAATWWFVRTPAATVRVASVQQSGGESAGAVLNASGYVTARREATVSSKVTGKVAEVLVEEGMRFKQGQVLARLDTLTQDASLHLAEAQLDEAKRTLDENEVRLKQAEITKSRQHRLLGAGASTQADVDSADADVETYIARLKLGQQQVEVAAKTVAQRKQDIDDMVIRAPFDGVVTTKDAQPGEMISPVSAGGGFTRTGICTLVDMNSLETDVDVNESYINRVHSGQHAEAVLDAYPDWRIPSTVIAVIPTADRQKATVKVRLAFDRLDPRILPDMGVKVAFLSDEPSSTPARAEARMPRAAVRQEGGQDVVFVLKGDRVERRAVKIGPAPGTDVTVISGVSPGEQVVIDGPPQLADGAKVVVPH
jgi:HlyD family secretion protein